MASWMVHLRIADILLDALPHISPTDFVMGNIAPDSGIPNEDWSSFTPSKKVSHFNNKEKKVDPLAFASKYFTKEQQKDYTKRQQAFYLGYLVHLLTDRLWSDKIAKPTMERYAEELAVDKRGTIDKIKDDWYDLDFLYLKQHPDFRAFSIYEKAVGYENCFMEEFSHDAFDNRRSYIADFYHQENHNLERIYPYLTEVEVEQFTAESAAQILIQLHTYYI